MARLCQLRAALRGTRDREPRFRIGGCRADPQAGQDRRRQGQQGRSVGRQQQEAEPDAGLGAGLAGW